MQAKVSELEQENAQLNEQLEQEKIRATNKEINKPSSKWAEWEKGASKGEDTGKKKRKRRNRKPRKGAGNRSKDLKPNRTAIATVVCRIYFAKYASFAMPFPILRRL